MHWVWVRQPYVVTYPMVHALYPEPCTWESGSRCTDGDGLVSGLTTLTHTLSGPRGGQRYDRSGLAGVEWRRNAGRPRGLAQAELVGSLRGHTLAQHQHTGMLVSMSGLWGRMTPRHLG